MVRDARIERRSTESETIAVVVMRIAVALLLLASCGPVVGRRRGVRSPLRRLNVTRAVMQRRLNVSRLRVDGICTAADIGLGPGMLSMASSTASIGNQLMLDGCTQLDLAMAPIGSEGAQALGYALGRSAARRTLTHVNLTWANVGDGCTMLLQALSKVPLLNSLDLSGNWIGDEFAGRISRMMRKTLHLRVLRLRWNSFTDGGARMIAQALPFSPHLCELDLGGNWLRSAGAGLIARRLQRHPGLQRVRLDHNGIDSLGMRALAQALAGNNSILQSLDVGGNEIDDAGVQELARLLSVPSALARVSLRLNERVTDAGAAMLAAAISSNTRLTHLDLGGNRIGNAGAAALSWAVSSNPGIRELKLDDNSPERRLGWAYARLDASIIRPLRATLAARRDGANMSNASARGARLPLELAQPHRLKNKNLPRQPRQPVNASAPRRPKNKKLPRQPVSASARPRPRKVIRIRSTSPSERNGGWWNRIKSVVRGVLWPVDSSSTGRRLSAAWKLGGRSGGGLRSASIRSNDLQRQLAYWRLVYPLATSETQNALVSGGALPNILVYKTAPRSLLGRSCEQQPWRVCRLDAYFGRGREPPKIHHGVLFAPFRMPPGTCMRNLFGWNAPTSRREWEGSYPYAAGVQDHRWVEVAHTRDQSGGAWMYLAIGSGIFWNCGTSLRARNKVDAAIRLTEKIAPTLPGWKNGTRAVDALAHAIESNDAKACDADHCTIFMQMLRSNRTDRNDNCYGQCSLAVAPLATWLERVAAGAEPSRWQWDHMSASSVFDQVIWQWAKRLGYDSVQLTMQPQVWCGLTWTTELLDLRVRRHRPLDLLPNLALRDPLAPADDNRGAPCVVRSDNSSRRTFHLCMYCEGTLMERAARCLTDASAGKPLRRFTIYSQYSRHRIDACSRVDSREY